jgi:hypothetical protein
MDRKREHVKKLQDDAQETRRLRKALALRDVELVQLRQTVDYLQRQQKMERTVTPTNDTKISRKRSSSRMLVEDDTSNQSDVRDECSSSQKVCVILCHIFKCYYYLFHRSCQPMSGASVFYVHIQSESYCCNYV